MANRSDDLAPLFGGGLEGITLHQGKVVTTNTDTNARGVEVDGAQFTGLPMLTTGAASLVVGDTVAVIRYNGGYFILGKISTLT